MIMNVSCVKMQYFGSRSLHPKRDYSSYLSLLSSYKYTDFKANFLNYFHEKFMPYFIGSFTRLWRNFNNCKKKKKPIAKFHNMIFIFILSKIKFLIGGMKIIYSLFKHAWVDPIVGNPRSASILLPCKRSETDCGFPTMELTHVSKDMWDRTWVSDNDISGDFTCNNLLKVE